MKHTGIWIVVAVVVAFVAMMITSFRGVSRYRVEVCMEFQGRSACRTASASSAEQARRTATDNACALIASGMSDSIACTNTTPAKITWMQGKP